AGTHDVGAERRVLTSAEPSTARPEPVEGRALRAGTSVGPYVEGVAVADQIRVHTSSSLKASGPTWTCAGQSKVIFVASSSDMTCSPSARYASNCFSEKNWLALDSCGNVGLPLR